MARIPSGSPGCHPVAGGWPRHAAPAHRRCFTTAEASPPRSAFALQAPSCSGTAASSCPARPMPGFLPVLANLLGTPLIPCSPWFLGHASHLVQFHHPCFRSRVLQHAEASAPQASAIILWQRGAEKAAAAAGSALRSEVRPHPVACRLASGRRNVRLGGYEGSAGRPALPAAA